MKRIISHAAQKIIEIEIPIGTLDKKIDIIIKTQNLSEHDKKLPLPKIFFEMEGIHIIEFKSERDPISSVVISKLLGYMGFYMANNQIGADKLEKTVFSWLVFAGMRSEFSNIKEDLKLSKITNGIYKSQRFGFLFFMVIDELDFQADNEIFIVNASLTRFNQYLKYLMQNRVSLTMEQKEYLRSRCYIDFGGVENMHEVNNYLQLSAAENIASAVKYAGVKEVIDALGVKEVIEAINLKKVVDEVGIKKVVDEVGIKKVVDEVGIKKVVDEVGIKKVVDEVGIKKVVKEIGVERVINELGFEFFIEQMLEVYDAEEIERVLEKVKKNRAQKPKNQ